MEIWLDTIDLPAIQAAKECGLLFGITTNPSIVSQSPQPLEDLLLDLLNCQMGPVAVQVTADNPFEMREQAKALFAFSSRLIIKIPATPEGLRAIASLKSQRIPTMATAIFEPLQGLLAAQAGASYLAPYVSHIGENAISTLETLQHLLKTHQLPAKILAAALKTPTQVLDCLRLGIPALTIKETLFHSCLIPPPQTLDFLAKFHTAYLNSPPSTLLPQKILK